MALASLSAETHTAASASGDGGDTAARFKDAMSRAATGVSIVTTAGPAGRCGLTVSAVASVSADPPQILVCINRRSPMAAALAENGVFAISLLAAGHRRLADIFAGRPCGHPPYDFGAADWSSLETGAPVLADAVAAFDCRLLTRVDTGTHRVCIASVIATRCSDAPPLVYVRRGYGVATPLEPEAVRGGQA